jgi:hypothetical protein
MTPPWGRCPATVTGFANLLTYTERLLAAVRHEITLDEAELEQIDQQMTAARERLPKLQAYVTAKASDVQIHWPDPLCPKLAPLVADDLGTREAALKSTLVRMWDYKVLFAQSDTELYSQLVAAGEEGWEAVSINQVPRTIGNDEDGRPFTVMTFLAWLKRPGGETGSILNKPIAR